MDGKGETADFISLEKEKIYDALLKNYKEKKYKELLEKNYKALLDDVVKKEDLEKQKQLLINKFKPKTTPKTWFQSKEPLESEEPLENIYNVSKQIIDIDKTIQQKVDKIERERIDKDIDILNSIIKTEESFNNDLIENYEGNEDSIQMLYDKKMNGIYPMLNGIRAFFEDDTFKEKKTFYSWFCSGNKKYASYNDECVQLDKEVGEAIKVEEEQRFRVYLPLFEYIAKEKNVELSDEDKKLKSQIKQEESSDQTLKTTEPSPGGKRTYKRYNYTKSINKQKKNYKKSIRKYKLKKNNM